MSAKVKQCFVPYCDNNTYKTPKKVFIATPSDSRKRQQWFEAASKAYNRPLRALTNSYCCEDHFDPNADFENWMEFKTVGTRLKLRPNVIPHVYRKRAETKAKDLSPPVLGKKRKRDNLNNEPNFEESSKNPVLKRAIEQTCHILVQANARFKNVYTNTPSVRKVSTGVNTLTAKVLALPFGNKIFTKNEDKPQSTLETNSITNYLTIIEKQSLLYLGIPKQYYFLIKLLSEHINCPHINILITLKKIRLNDRFARLASDFSLSETCVIKIFIYTVPKMADVLKRLIVWPVRSNIFWNLPIKCRMKFRNVQSVVDYFEIQVEQPTSSSNQLLTWSVHKSINTIKYLISISLDGSINFLSPGYGGRTSKIFIIKNCGYLETLPHNTTILGDRTLKQLETLLAIKNCKLITDMTANEELKEQVAKDGQQLTTLRRQISTVICRLREFQMLHVHSCIETRLD